LGNIYLSVDSKTNLILQVGHVCLARISDGGRWIESDGGTV